MITRNSKFIGHEQHDRLGYIIYMHLMPPHLCTKHLPVLTEKLSRFKNCTYFTCNQNSIILNANVNAMLRLNMYSEIFARILFDAVYISTNNAKGDYMKY